MASADGEVSALCADLVDRLPVDGAAISTIGGLGDAHTISASNRVAGRMDEAQLDLVEGPCWDAVGGKDWVDSPELRSGETRWPGFREAVRDEPLAAVFACPLWIGGLQVGTVDLYRRGPGPLPSSAKEHAGRFVDRASQLVLRSTLARLGMGPEAEVRESAPRAIIHQAVGMVLAQVPVTPEDAMLLLRARAFATGQTLREIARDVLDRRLDFSAADEVAGVGDD